MNKNLRRKIYFFLDKSKTYILIIGGVIILTTLVLGVLDLIEQSKFREYMESNELIEENTKSFILTHSEYVPERIGWSKVIPLTEIMDDSFMMPILDPKTNEVCDYESSSVVVLSKEDGLSYKSFLKCPSYNSIDETKPEIEIDINDNDLTVTAFETQYKEVEAPAIFLEDDNLIETERSFNLDQSFTYTKVFKIEKTGYKTGYIFTQALNLKDTAGIQASVNSSGELTLIYSWETIFNKVDISSYLDDEYHKLKVSYKKSTKVFELYMDDLLLAKHTFRGAYRGSSQTFVDSGMHNYYHHKYTGYFENTIALVKLQLADGTGFEYNCEEGKGTTLFDVSGNSNHGALKGETPNLWSKVQTEKNYNLTYGYNEISTSNGTNDYINTGVYPNSNVRIEIKGKYNKVGMYNIPIGSESLNSNYYFGVQSNYAIGLGFADKEAKDNMGWTPDINVHTYEIKDKTLYIDGNKVESYKGDKKITNPNTIFIYASNSYDLGDRNHSNFTTYYIKIYDGNTLIKHFIPNENGTLLDIIENKIYRSGGSGLLTSKVPSLKAENKDVYGVTTTKHITKDAYEFKNSGVRRMKIDENDWVYNDFYTFENLETGRHKVTVEDYAGNKRELSILISK